MKKVLQDMKFTPSDKGKYYFISYSREDLERVRIIARELYDYGVTLWYDKGIEYGSKWKPVISRHIKNSEGIILFATQKLFQRNESYVQTEFEIACSISKKLTIVFLDDVDPQKIPDDNLAFFTEIKQLNYINAFSMEHNELIDEILTAINFNLESKNADSESGYTKECGETLKTVQPAEAVLDFIDEGNSEKNINPKTKNNKTKGILGKIKKILLIIIISIAVLFGVLVIVVFNEGKSKYSIRCNEMSVSKIQKEIRKNKKFEYLVLKNCYGDFSVLADSLKERQNIRSLIITDCSFENFSDFSSLPEFTHLSILSVINCSLNSVSGIEKYKNLTEVTLSGNNITSISEMSGISKLSVLDVSSNSLDSVCGLENALYLKKLNISDNHIKKLDGIINCSVMETFNAENNSIDDFSVLSKSTEFLKYVDISGNNSSVNLKVFNTVPNLISLDISGNSPVSPETISKLTSLKKLLMDSCKLTDFEISSDVLGNLEVLSACNNSFENPDTFSFPDDSCINTLYLSDNNFKGEFIFNASQLKVLDLHNNKFETVSINPGASCYIEKLYLYNNPVKSITFSGNEFHSYIYIPFISDMDYEAPGYICHVFNIVNCPLDQQAALKEKNSSQSINFISSDEADLAILETKETALNQIY